MPRASIGDTTIHYETFGEPDDPAIVLIAGLASQLTAWPEEFCLAFVDRGFRVVRFDNRDSGLSRILSDGAAYSLSDMAADTAGLIDALDAAPAHVVGNSMGGMIAQTLAIEHPEVVASLVSIASTTGNPAVGRPTPEALDALLLPRPRTRDEAIERDLVGKRIWGTPGAWDEDDYRRQSAANFDRSAPEGAAERQFAALTGDDRDARLAAVDVPALVIHGSLDPLIDVSGGRRTAEVIPGARYLEIEGMGHDLPARHWPEIVHAITELAAQALSGRR